MKAVLRRAENRGQKTFRFRENFRDLVLLDRPDFDGQVYERNRDHMRLSGQMLRIYDLMADGSWRTLDEISTDTADPPASISAQLRHLRKDRFGAHRIDKRRRDEGALWEYRLEKTDQENNP